MSRRVKLRGLSALAMCIGTFGVLWSTRQPWVWVTVICILLHALTCALVGLTWRVTR